MSAEAKNVAEAPQDAAASEMEQSAPGVSAASAAEAILSAKEREADDSLAVDIARSSATELPSKEPELTKEEMIEEALNCPCIASMKDGPCGDAFIAAYRCFLESETEPKGMDCMQQFTGMQSCMAEHPDEYNLDDDDDGEENLFKGSSGDSAATAEDAGKSRAAVEADDSKVEDSILETDQEKPISGLEEIQLTSPATLATDTLSKLTLASESAPA